MYRPEANAARHARAELKRAFPGTRFSVRSGDDRISVQWTGGPDKSSLRNLLSCYERQDGVQPPALPACDRVGEIRLKRHSTAGEGNHGAPWTPAEESELLEAYDRGDPLDGMAESHGRTENALLGRLVKLGRLVNLGGIYYRLGAIWHDARDP